MSDQETAVIEAAEYVVMCHAAAQRKPTERARIELAGALDFLERAVKALTEEGS